MDSQKGFFQECRKIARNQVAHLLSHWLFATNPETYLSRIVHSTRLFPVGRGANQYFVTGVASLCDWVILSDTVHPKINVRRRRQTSEPCHIFLSLRNAPEAICFFATKILPALRQPYVLVSGSEDVTIPNQTDQRWPSFKAEVHQALDEIENHDLLLHWFAENLDARWSKKVSPLPTGRVFPENRSNSRLRCPRSTRICDRPLRVFCGHRIREGRQWEPRKKVTNLAKNQWSVFSEVLEDFVSEKTFADFLKAYPFVLCVEGGGLDPSPKAWHAIQCGALPVIRKTATWDAYRQLPCVGVDFWSEDQLNLPTLESWRMEWKPHFEQPHLRALILRKLSLGYWWEKIQEKSRRVVPQEF